LIRPLGYVREPIRAVEVLASCCQDVTAKKHKGSAEVALAEAGLVAQTPEERESCPELLHDDLPVLY